MKFSRKFAVLLALSTPGMAFAEAPSMNTLSVEALGAGGLYSVFYSRRIGDFALNVGFSQWSFTFFQTSHVTALPISGSYLMGGPNGNFELNLGFAPMTVTTDAGTLSFGDLGVLPLDGGTDTTGYSFLGVGYRYWPIDGGFHFRLTAYLLGNSDVVAPFGGISLGYAF